MNCPHFEQFCTREFGELEDAENFGGSTSSRGARRHHVRIFLGSLRGIVCPKIPRNTGSELMGSFRKIQRLTTTVWFEKSRAAGEPDIQSIQATLPNPEHSIRTWAPQLALFETWCPVRHISCTTACTVRN